MLRQYFASFDEICATGMNPLLFFVRLTLTNIVNTPLDRSAALDLSVSNSMYCSCAAVRQIRLEIWLEPDLAGFPKKWPDYGAGAEIRYKPRKHGISLSADVTAVMLTRIRRSNNHV